VTITEKRQGRVRRMLDSRLGSVVVILEAVRRRHNSSAIMRSCECFGVHEVHLVRGNFRPSRGAARGAERWLDIHHHDTTESAVTDLKRRGFSIFVADLMEGAHSPDSIPLDGPIAILMGAELTGVSDEARALADGAICVPMRGVTESLNVSVAAACVLQRVTERRREQVGEGDLPPERKDSFFAEWVDREIESRRGMVLRTKASSAADH
jgi:tRNA (guanosine-2'-O-)-methyltransferase